MALALLAIEDIMTARVTRGHSIEIDGYAKNNTKLAELTMGCSFATAFANLLTIKEEAVSNRRDEQQGGQEPGPAPAEEPSLPPPACWSVGFTGGTFDRCKERCSADFNQVRETKALGKLPKLHEDEVEEAATEAEKKILQSKGLEGRYWFSQAMVFDEAYF